MLNRSELNAFLFLFFSILWLFSLQIAFVQFFRAWATAYTTHWMLAWTKNLLLDGGKCETAKRNSNFWHSTLSDFSGAVNFTQWNCFSCRPPAAAASLFCACMNFLFWKQRKIMILKFSFSADCLFGIVCTARWANRKNSGSCKLLLLKTLWMQ